MRSKVGGFIFVFVGILPPSLANFVKIRMIGGGVKIGKGHAEEKLPVSS